MYLKQGRIASGLLLGPLWAQPLMHSAATIDRVQDFRAVAARRSAGPGHSVSYAAASAADSRAQRPRARLRITRHYAWDRSALSCLEAGLVPSERARRTRAPSGTTSRFRR